MNLELALSDLADGGSAFGVSQLATTTGGVDDGYTVKLAVRIDTSTEPSGGGGGGPGPGGNPPGSPGR